MPDDSFAVTYGEVSVRLEGSDPFCAYQAMKKEALATDSSKPFNEQDLRFRSFGIFLDHAKEHTICFIKCTVHRGNVWVDHK